MFEYVTMIGARVLLKLRIFATTDDLLLSPRPDVSAGDLVDEDKSDHEYAKLCIFTKKNY
jgi:hypothetical protein